MRRARCFSQAKLVPAVNPHTHSNGARAAPVPSDIATRGRPDGRAAHGPRLRQGHKRCGQAILPAVTAAAEAARGLRGRVGGRLVATVSRPLAVLAAPQSSPCEGALVPSNLLNRKTATSSIVFIHETVCPATKRCVQRQINPGAFLLRSKVPARTAGIRRASDVPICGGRGTRPVTVGATKVLTVAGGVRARETNSGRRGASRPSLEGDWVPRA